MATSAEIQASIDKLETNMTRLDQFTNGSNTTDVVVDSGTVPSIAKFIAETQQDLTDITDSLLGTVEANVGYATEWATKPENTPVSIAAGGDNSTTFSSLHWAKKAQEAFSYVPTRTALKALDTTIYKSVYLSEAGRQGQWSWTPGYFFTELNEDTSEGLYIKANAIASTAGAWVRNYKGAISPLWFGAKTDGTDSLTAMNAFINMMTVVHVAGELPAGTITLSGPLTKNVGSNQFALRGQGSGISVLTFTGGSGGIGITCTNISGTTQISNQIHMSDFSVLTTQFLGGTAVKVTVSPTIASSVTPIAYIERLVVRGFDVTADTWTDGIWLQDSWNSAIMHCFVKGLDDASDPFDMQSGISLQQCNDCHVGYNHVYHCEYAINNSSAIVSYGDGVLIHDNRCVGVGYGVLATGNSTSGNEFVGIVNNHFNAYMVGIQLSNIGFTPVTGNLIFKTNLSTQNDWTGILLTGSLGSNQNRITLNQVSLPGAPVTASNWGVWLTSGSNDNQVSDNIFNLAGAGQHYSGVFLNNSANKNLVHDNKCDASVSPPISIGSSAGNTNFIHDNYPHMEIQLFPANSATPSVGNLIDGQGATANSSATTITNFNDAVTGQTWTILINDLFTTVQNNGGVILKGGVNVTPATPGAAGGFMTFKRVLGATREVSRTF